MSKRMYIIVKICGVSMPSNILMFYCSTEILSSSLLYELVQNISKKGRFVLHDDFVTWQLSTPCLLSSNRFVKKIVYNSEIQQFKNHIHTISVVYFRLMPVWTHFMA